MTFKSAYLRLTIFYTLIIMIISAGFSSAIYKISSNEIGRGLSDQARVFREMPQTNIIPNNWQELENIRADQQTASAKRLRLYLFLEKIPMAHWR